MARFKASRLWYFTDWFYRAWLSSTNGTDSIIAEAIANELAKRFPYVFVVPKLPYSASFEHTGFPGSISLRFASVPSSTPLYDKSLKSMTFPIPERPSVLCKVHSTFLFVPTALDETPSPESFHLLPPKCDPLGES